MPSARAVNCSSSALRTCGAAITREVAVSLGRKPASLSPARDSLIKKGLVYSAERGQIAFTVPHFGRYLLSHPE